MVRPGASSEDDSIILSVVLDGMAQRSYMFCLDAETMTEVGRAETDFPIAIGCTVSTLLWLSDERNIREI